MRQPQVWNLQCTLQTRTPKRVCIICYELYVMLKITGNLVRWILIYYTQSSNLSLKACAIFPVFNVHLKTKFIACTS